MTDTTNDVAEAQETAQEAAEAQQADQDTTDQEQAQEATPNAEAKKWRLRLRESEAQNETAQATIQQLQNTVLNNALNGSINVTPQSGNRAVHDDGTTKTVEVKLRNPEDLFTVGGADRGNLFNDDGGLDTEALSQAATELYSSRPDLFDKADSGAVPSISNSPETATSMNSWQKLLQGK